MIWPCQSCPASKIYVDGKLCLKGPDGSIMEMAHVFQDTAKGYQLWIQNLVTFFNSKAGVAWGHSRMDALVWCDFQSMVSCIVVGVVFWDYGVLKWLWLLIGFWACKQDPPIIIVFGYQVW